jgi:Fur family transcriptional regulator, iron response regulator
MHRNLPGSGSDEAVGSLLRAHGINPTSQRAEVAALLFSRREHLSAEDVYSLMKADGLKVSKATIYNTLGLFAERGLIRELIVDPERVYYDPNTKPHHHFYDVSTGILTDIDASAVQVSGLPALPEGSELEGMDVIVRLRPSGTPVQSP